MSVASAGMSPSTLNRIGLKGGSRNSVNQTGFFGQAQYDHAFPLLTHDELGHSENSAKMDHVMLSKYMPKRAKGTAPWFRGADTYSVKYAEQGRYEYQRYLMIARLPGQYKNDFANFLRYIRECGKKGSLSLPQEAVHWIQRMIVDNYNPQHCHYIAGMEALMNRNEIDMARDVWKMMERQQTIPCDRTIATYLEVCRRAKEPTWAFECWNRYCSEKRFLEKGEMDPKPVSRVPFALNRDEMLHLPKWKKFFDHDPNLDVTDLNRFNTTRQIYSKMAQVMLCSGEMELFEEFFGILEKQLLESPTPVPEPPNPLFVPIPRWSPHLTAATLKTGAWRLDNTERANALGPTTTSFASDLAPRFFSNKQFLVYTVAQCIRHLAASPPATLKGDAGVKFGSQLLDRLIAAVGPSVFATLETETLFVAVLHLYRQQGNEGGQQLMDRLQAMLKAKAKAGSGGAEVVTAPQYLQVLKGFVRESKDRSLPSFNPQKTMKELAGVIQQMTSDATIVWAADMHLEIIKTMVQCGTMMANSYFVTNVLRKFDWNCTFLEALYPEYRRAADVDTWSELTKRALVWTARYDVPVTEEFKRMVEDDYATIKVQVRTFRELAVFQFRNVEEERVARDPVNLLANPYTDFVAHALPFPDRDVGYPNEYGDIGQWRNPADPAKGPEHRAPQMYGENLKAYTSEWRDPTNPNAPPAMPNPWERKYQQYARGQHPSYDMTYAGPNPEIFPERKVFRQKTRWDQFDINKQSKFKMMGAH